MWAGKCGNIAEVINRLKSDAHILEDFDPRELGVFLYEMLEARERKTPIELLIRRAPSRQLNQQFDCSSRFPQLSRSMVVKESRAIRHS